MNLQLRPILIKQKSFRHRKHLQQQGPPFYPSLIKSLFHSLKLENTHHVFQQYSTIVNLLITFVPSLINKFLFSIQWASISFLIGSVSPVIALSSDVNSAASTTKESAGILQYIQKNIYTSIPSKTSTRSPVSTSL